MDEFNKITPENMYITITNELYNAHQRGDVKTVDMILSAFDNDRDARRLLIIGTACLRALGEQEYRSAIMSSMAAALYEHFNNGGINR